MRHFTGMAAALRVVSLIIVATGGGELEAGANPSWRAELTKRPPGEVSMIEPCRLEYVFSWSKIVVAGRSVVTIGGEEDERYPGTLVGRSQGGSRGAARLLWPYDHSFVSIIDPVSLRPVAFHSTEVDRRETLWTTSRFGRSGVDVKAVTLEKKSGVREEKKKEFPFPECHDLMSALLYARSLPMNVGDKVVVLTHPFGSAYLVTFTILGKEKHGIGLGKFDAFKIDVGIAKVRDDLSLKHYKKFKKATVWISDDAYRIPLELRADVFIGSVRVILKKREFLGEEG